MVEVAAAYDDNAGYAEDASTTKAHIFATACRILLRRKPKRIASGGRGEEIELDLPLIRDELSEARRFVAGQGGAVTGGAKALGFQDFRS